MAVATEQTATYGEIRVETGTGLIKKLEHEPGKRNAHVVIHATHTNLREPVQAWADTTDGAIWPTCTEAHAAGLEVEYRIEVRRKPDVDKARPLAELGNREKVRDLAAIARKGELSQVDRIAGQQAPTAPPAAERADSVLDAGKAATAQRQAAYRHEDAPPPAASTPSPFRCEPCDHTAASSAELLEHARGPQHQATEARLKVEQQRAAAQAAATFDDRAADRDRPIPPAANGRRKAKIEEGKPWELYNTDGTLNLASYSYQAVLGFVELAHDLVSQRVRDVIVVGPAAPELRIGQVESLARLLLEAADKCQAMTRQDGRVDRMDASHTRARGAIRTALKVYPVPWGADADTRAAWLENLATHAASLTRVALHLFRLHETGDGE